MKEVAGVDCDVGRESKDKASIEADRVKVNSKKIGT
jgi:hypothetical protein